MPLGCAPRPDIHTTWRFQINVFPEWTLLKMWRTEFACAPATPLMKNNLVSEWSRRSKIDWTMWKIEKHASTVKKKVKCCNPQIWSPNISLTMVRLGGGWMGDGWRVLSGGVFLKHCMHETLSLTELYIMLPKAKNCNWPLKSVGVNPEKINNKTFTLLGFQKKQLPKPSLLRSSQSWNEGCMRPNPGSPPGTS